MRYSTEPRFRKYVTGYGFLSFAKKFGNKYGKKLIDTATKTGIDAAKTASKKVVQQTPEATGDLIRNKIADQITSMGKPKENETKETEEIYIPPEKTQQIIDDLRFFECSFLEYKVYLLCIKMEFQKIVNFLDKTSDNKDLPRFVAKKWIELYDESEKIITQTKKLELKHQC